MSATFWDSRYEGAGYAYGTRPNAFIAEQAAAHLAAPADVLDLGAGEGRNAVFLAREGHRVIAVDYAAVGLAKVRQLAARHGVEVETVQADVTTWRPDRQWDAVVVAFLHVGSAERPALYALLQQLLRPGGLLLAEWFRPEQVYGDYPSGGPRSADLLVPLAELHAAFPADGTLLAEEAEVVLDEGLLHQGPAAVVRLAWQKPLRSPEEEAYDRLFGAGF